MEMVADFRMSDLQFVIELAREAVERESGARERISERYGVQKSVITDRVKRIEAFLGIALFQGPQRKTPTPAGRILAKRGPAFISEVQSFAELIRSEIDRPAHQITSSQILEWPV